MRQVDGDMCLRAERLQNDVAPLADLGLFSGEFARFHQSLHERLILGELLYLAVAHHVGAAVPDLHQKEVIAEQSGDRHGGAHTAVLRVFPSVLMDARVGEHRGVTQRLRKHGRRRVGCLPRMSQRFEHECPGHAAGQLPGCGAAHAVGDEKQQPVRIGRDLVIAVREVERRPGFEVSDEKRVFVVLPSASHVGERKDPRDHAVVTRRTFSM